MDYSTITPNSGPVSGVQNVEKPRPMPVVSKDDVVRREAGIGVSICIPVSQLLTINSYLYSADLPPSFFPRL